MNAIYPMPMEQKINPVNSSVVSILSNSSHDQLLEGRLSLTGILILNRHRQCLAGANEDSQFSGSGQTGVDEIPEQHFEMLGEDRNNHRFKFTALTFFP